MEKFEKLEVEVSMLKAKTVYLEQMLEALISKIQDQPERSKREDLSKADYDLADYINGRIDWDELKMRCSEL